VAKAKHPTWPTPPEVLGAEDVGLEVQVDTEPTEPIDELAQAIAERDEYLDQLQRSRAEFVNFKRRNDQERALLRQYVSREVLAQFLPVIDDLERALTTIPEEERENGWVKGVTLIQAKLNGTAERIGVSKIDALGQPFDPSIHESVATEPESDGSTVVEIYQNGYRIGDLLVRPAMVKTGNASVDPIEDDTDEFNA